MRQKVPAAAGSLLAVLAGVAAGAGAQPGQGDEAPWSGGGDPRAASATSNLAPRAGEASTMTRGVPNMRTSNPQPGELGIQEPLTVRQRAGSPPTATKMMSASSPAAPRLESGAPQAPSPTVEGAAVR